LIVTYQYRFAGLGMAHRPYGLAVHVCASWHKLKVVYGTLVVYVNAITFIHHNGQYAVKQIKMADTG
jgi:hypothetical protein